MLDVRYFNSDLRFIVENSWYRFQHIYIYINKYIYGYMDECLTELKRACFKLIENNEGKEK